MVDVQKDKSLAETPVCCKYLLKVSKKVKKTINIYNCHYLCCETCLVENEVLILLVRLFCIGFGTS